MHELSGFEQRLAVALGDYAGPRRPVEAATIARRATASEPARRMRPAVVWRRDLGESRTLLRVALVAALVVTLIAGGLLVGSWLPRTADPPTPLPSAMPSLMASTFSCAEAQAVAARTTTTWTAGPAPASPSTADNGWIAVWGSDEVPELFLIDPVSDARCLLARFEAYRNPPHVATPEGPRDWIPPRGPLVWSPDGQALAFIVLGQDGAVRDLYVWSEVGLAGPLLSLTEDFIPGRPSWSPDGSMLAVADVTSHPRQATDVWILSRSGGPAKPIASGCVCRLSPVTWSETGRRIVTTTVMMEDRTTGIVAGSVDDAGMRPVRKTDIELAGDYDAAPFGFVDEASVLIADPSTGRFVGRRLDGGADRDIGPLGVTLDTITSHRTSLAPDRSAWLLAGGNLLVADISGGMRTIVPALPEFFPFGWAANSDAVGYVLDLQGADQGVWVVNRDGTGGRRVVAGPFVLHSEGSSAFAWQPVWPIR